MLREQAAAEGIMPLEYMLLVMRDDKQPDSRRDAMAQSAAPYLHPRLSATTVYGTINSNVNIAAAKQGLAGKLARLEESEGAPVLH